MKPNISIYGFAIAVLLLIGVGEAVAQDNPSQTDVKIGGSVYGGGDMSQVEGSTEVNIHKSLINENIFGGGKGLVKEGGEDYLLHGQVTDSTWITIENALWSKENPYAGSIYGGGELGKAAHTNVLFMTGISKGNVFGASRGEVGVEEKGQVQTTLVHINGATVDSIFGGGELAGVSGASAVLLSKGQVNGGVYGGSYTKGDIGQSKVTLAGGKVGAEGHPANVHGGGFGADTRTSGNVSVLIQGEGAEVWGDVYGGSALGHVNKDANDTTLVHLANGLIHGDIYGGGLGDDTHAAMVNGRVLLTVDGGQVEQNVYGCNNVNGSPQDSVFVYVNDDKFIQNVYGGGNQADYAGVPFVSVGGGNIGRVYGGGNLAQVGGTHVTVSNGQIEKVYGGGYQGNVLSSTYVRMQGGQAGQLFGGNDITGTIADSTHVTIINGTNRPVIGEVYAGGDGANTPDSNVPNVSKSHLHILGGAIGYAYGGGNAATVYDSAYIHVDTDNKTFASDSIFDAERLFGGNNLAEMSIQPQWNLVSGHLGSVYSGGNMGKMTYYNPAPGENEVKGIRIDVTSGRMYIDKLFGGCRMADVGLVDRTFNDADDTADRYGANVFVSAGHIESVYGGNDVSGMVHNGTHLEIRGAISGDIYGGGNGDYIYKYEKGTEESVTEMYDSERDLTYYLVKSVNEVSDDAAKIAEINRFRPNVPRAFLNIQGTESDPVFIKGDVYTGGNSASISERTDDGKVNVRFEVGSYVNINGVYMGCNGQHLTDTTYLARLFGINQISTPTPALLNQVMNAVEMNALPKGFDDFGTKDISHAHIGVFCLGGNAGSLTTDKHVVMSFPKGLDIYNRIVGGCNNTDFSFRGVKHEGGLKTPLADGQDTKVTLNVACTFTPQYIHLDKNEFGYEDDAHLEYQLGTDAGKKIFSERRCNIYGGCYTSGTTVGNVEINVKTDMLDQVVGQTIDGMPGEDILKNTNYLKYSAAKSSASVPYVFSIFGGGYGSRTNVLGNVHITMPYEKEGGNVLRPRVNTLYGGSEQGRVVGNVLVEVRNGEVFNSIFGGSDAAKLYGSTQTVIGYPSYYTSNDNKEYLLDRSDKSADNLSRISPERDNILVVKQDAKYQTGEIVPLNVYQTIKDRADADFTEATVAPSDLVSGGSWDDIRIKVGSGIYGGGYSASYSREESAGSYTVCAFDAENNLDASTVGWGGNASILVADDSDQEHIVISTPPANVHAMAKNVGGDGGIFGCGHLTFTEGFRSVDISNYGYAGHTVEDPLTLNTFQRIDLLTLRDCCMKIWGSRDFATNSVDATVYSIARVHEVNMQSSIDPSSNLPSHDHSKSRNYIGFMNNMHYFGSLVTNDSFENGYHHDSLGHLTPNDTTYQQQKKHYVDEYRIVDDANKAILFKQRNVGTARNLIGINNGYCLKIQNQYKEKNDKDEWENKMYYGPIIGVAEVKLLSFVPGEGGGYVYADNLHHYDPAFLESDNRVDSVQKDNEHFVQCLGNFVFPGAQGEVQDDQPDKDPRQYIVDDCFPHRYQTMTQTADNQAEAHYWYVQGTKYFFNTVLTGYTSNANLQFNLDNEDGIVQISGLPKGNPVALESVAWRSETDEPGVYSADIKDASKNYTFDVRVGEKSAGDYLTIEKMPRYTWNHKGFAAPDTIVGLPVIGLDDSLTVAQKGKIYESESLPVFDLILKDSVNNYGEDYYLQHMERPEEVLITMKAIDDEGQLCTYYITAIVQYLQGPFVKGDVHIQNCALPGERIRVAANFIISGDDNMKISDKKWKILAKTGVNTYQDPDEGTIVPEEYIVSVDNENSYLLLPAYYEQNGYKLAYTFKAVGTDFGFTGELSSSDTLLTIHNYHRMKKAAELRADACDGSRIYIKDAEDLNAFQKWVNDGKRTAGLHFILQNDLTLPAGWSLSKDFKGTFHGDGYHLTASDDDESMFGDKLTTTGRVYNLGMVGGRISDNENDRPNESGFTENGSNVFNSYEFIGNDDYRYGSNAYKLSHHFDPDHDVDDYVANFYANGDYQYATTDDSWSLRTHEEPNYGSADTHHDMSHAHDALRWDDVKEINVPLYDGSSDPYNNDYLFYGQSLRQTGRDSIPTHISRKADNRVYETAGYYQSLEDQKFYYNPEAWAVQPTLTAVMFGSVETPEDDNAKTAPKSFDADSNADYGDEYSNETEGHITQNLLVYHPADAVGVYKVYGDSTAEEFVRYHSITMTPSDTTIQYLHLVDKQDFCAPESYRVTGRAWYERKPEQYRAIGTPAWEGICLPFTATRVIADGNGEVSHFYGKDSVNHEYWLRGMTKIDDDKVIFREPGTDGGSFVDSRQTEAKFDYTYHNHYFANLDSYQKDRNFGAHYAQAADAGVLFEGYIPLTAMVPYLVSMPGQDYYEFSMSGMDYDIATHVKTGASQSLTFENRPAGGKGTLVEASGSGKGADTTSVDSYRHIGTYMHLDGQCYVVDSEGAAFDQSTSASILPFRTYMINNPSGSSAAPRRLMISGLGAVGPSEDVAEPENLEIVVRGQEVIVTSTYGVTIPLQVYLPSGQIIQTHQATPGISTFRLPMKGVYIIRGQKVVSYQI